MSDLRIAPVVLDELAGIAPPLRAEIEAMLGAQEAAKSPPTGEVSTLLGAYRGTKLVGAVYFRLQAGRVATVWPPRIAVGESSPSATALMQATIAQLQLADVRFAQSLLESDASADFEVLRSVGFHHLTDLLYLACTINGESLPGESLRSEDPAARVAPDLHFTPYRPHRHDRFAKIVEATYEGSLDCPGMDGMRDMNDVLAGYRATGIFDPDRWLLVSSGIEDVGCLILTEYEGQGTWELVYMGLLPTARGRRWGLAIVEHAKRMAATAGRTRLVLAVDGANTPALRAYTQAGFQVWNQRSVMILSLKDSECSG